MRASSARWRFKRVAQTAPVEARLTRQARGRGATGRRVGVRSCRRPSQGGLSRQTWRCSGGFPDYRAWATDRRAKARRPSERWGDDRGDAEGAATPPLERRGGCAVVELGVGGRSRGRERTQRLLVTGERDGDGAGEAVPGDADGGPALGRWWVLRLARRLGSYRPLLGIWAATLHGCRCEAAFHGRLVVRPGGHVSPDAGGKRRRHRDAGGWPERPGTRPHTEVRRRRPAEACDAQGGRWRGTAASGRGFGMPATTKLDWVETLGCGGRLPSLRGCGDTHRRAGRAATYLGRLPVVWGPHGALPACACTLGYVVAPSVGHGQGTAGGATARGPRRASDTRRGPGAALSRGPTGRVRHVREARCRCS